MRKVVTVTEVSGEGLISLLNEKIVVFCMNYIYSGVLTGINDTCILLEDAGIVYETGELTNKNFKDFQKLPSNLYIQTASIESFYKRA
jgi:hypothetical protein